MVFSWWVWLRLIFIMFSFCGKTCITGITHGRWASITAKRKRSWACEQWLVREWACQKLQMHRCLSSWGHHSHQRERSMAAYVAKAKGPGWNGPWSPCPKCCSEFIISNKSNKLGHFKAGNTATKFFDPKPSMCCFPVSCFLQLIFARFKRIRQENIDGIGWDDTYIYIYNL